MITALLNEIRACRDCAGQLEPNPIVQLAADSKIIIASQAPGRVAHETGIPFQDASGRRLREWLGVTEAEFYEPANFAILPMAFCFPGSGKSGDLPPPRHCAERWRQRCLDTMAGAEIVLLVGQYAQAWHLGPSFTSLTETVADWEAYAPRLFPLPHPSPRNTPWLRRNPWFEASLLPMLRERVRTSLAQT